MSEHSIIPQINGENETDRRVSQALCNPLEKFARAHELSFLTVFVQPRVFECRPQADILVENPEAHNWCSSVAGVVSLVDGIVVNGLPASHALHGKHELRCNVDNIFVEHVQADKARSAVVPPSVDKQ